MNETPTMSLVKFEELPAITASAPEVLMQNQNLLEKAKAKGNSLLDTIQGEGMNDELDAMCNDFLVQCKKADGVMKQRRNPITQLFTAIAKEFTSLEAPLDSTKPDSIYSKIQLHRNAYAKQKAEAQRLKELEIQKQRAMDQERIDVKGRIEQGIRDKYLSVLYSFKQKAADLFNSLTLENFADVTSQIQALKDFYPMTKFNEIRPTVTAVYLDKDAMEILLVQTQAELYEELSLHFKENMQDTKANLMDQLPSRKSELEEISKASAAEKNRLLAEAQRRREEEVTRLAAEAEENRLKAEQQTNLNKEIANADSAFDADNALAQIQDTSGAQVRQGYKINIKNSQAYQHIAAFWFTNIWDKSEDPAKTGKKTLDQMKGDCEKFAHKHGIKVVSVHLTYEEDFKAIAKKA